MCYVRTGLIVIVGDVPQPRKQIIIDQIHQHIHQQGLRTCGRMNCTERTLIQLICSVIGKELDLEIEDFAVRRKDDWYELERNEYKN